MSKVSRTGPGSIMQAFGNHMIMGLSTLKQTKRDHNHIYLIGSQAFWEHDHFAGTKASFGSRRQVPQSSHCAHCSCSLQSITTSETRSQPDHNHLLLMQENHKSWKHLYHENYVNHFLESFARAPHKQIAPCKLRADEKKILSLTLMESWSWRFV